MRLVLLTASVLLAGCYTYAGAIQVDGKGDMQLHAVVEAVVGTLVDEYPLVDVAHEFPENMADKEIEGAEYRTVGIYRLHSPVDAPDQSFDLFVRVRENGGSASFGFRDLQRSAPSDYVRAFQDRLVAELARHVPAEQISIEHRRIIMLFAP